jgi:hypothetical protein
MKLLDIIFESVVDMNEHKRLTTDEFIKMATEKWNGKYTYDNVDYKGSFIKVKITCPIHGDFPQSPSNHLLGKEGCKECSQIHKSSNTEDFIKKAQGIHFLYDENGKKIPKYTYNNVVYINAHKNVNITCPIHGDFPQPPHSHLRGSGCDKCGIESRKSNTKEFIKRAQNMSVHQNEDGTPKYTYDNVNYVNKNIKVLITCPLHSPIHGDFPQSPDHHLGGHGCPWCNESKGEKRIKQILFEKNIEYIPLKKYDDCISYRSKNGLNKKCTKLEFDFYLSDYDILIEFDGKYHFKKEHDNQDFTNQVLNDREKNDYTKAKGKKLIRIGYLDIKNIEEELMKGLDSNDQLYLSTKYPIDKGWRDTTIKV